jgi:hypothetical protein
MARKAMTVPFLVSAFEIRNFDQALETDSLSGSNVSFWTPEFEGVLIDAL